MAFTFIMQKTADWYLFSPNLLLLSDNGYDLECSLDFGYVTNITRVFNFPVWLRNDKGLITMAFLESVLFRSFR